MPEHYDRQSISHKIREEAASITPDDGNQIQLAEL